MNPTESYIVVLRVAVPRPIHLQNREPALIRVGPFESRQAAEMALSRAVLVPGLVRAEIIAHPPEWAAGEKGGSPKGNWAFHKHS